MTVRSILGSLVVLGAVALTTSAPAAPAGSVLAQPAKVAAEHGQSEVQQIRHRRHHHHRRHHRR